ncbi:MAG TPA: methyltransferase type 11 [Aldersonia sp.]
MESAVVDLLACPECESDLEIVERTLLCATGHSFDIARQGYVSLLTGAATKMTGDTAEMVLARDQFLAAGHFAPIAAAVTEAVAASSAGPARVLEIGAGTGYYLAHVLDAQPDGCGVGLDVAKPAARRLARAHPRAGAVVADAWQRLPLRGAAFTHALSVFAPRNAAEVWRCLTDDGTYVVVTPTAQHLRELIAPLGMVGVDADKTHRLGEAMSGWFERASRTTVEFEMSLAPADIEAVVGMGPSGHHLSAATRTARIAALRADVTGVTVTASVQVSCYRPA